MTFNMRDLVADELQDAAADHVNVPVQRVGWAHRELDAAGMPQNSIRNEDGSHSFRIDEKNGPILDRVVNWDHAGREWGDKGTGATPRNNLLILVAGGATMFMFAGAIFQIATIGLITFFATFPVWLMAGTVILPILSIFFVLRHRGHEQFLDSHGHDVGGNPK